MDPLTFRGHKFDVRLWALVTSLEPLRVYVLRRGVPKISQMRYTAAPGATKDQCMHVLLPGTTECYRSKQAEVIWPYPNSTDGDYFLGEPPPPYVWSYTYFLCASVPHKPNAYVLPT